MYMDEYSRTKLEDMMRKHLMKNMPWATLAPPPKIDFDDIMKANTPRIGSDNGMLVYRAAGAAGALIVVLIAICRCCCRRARSREPPTPRRVTGFSAAIPMPAPPRAGLSRSATPMEGLSTPVPTTARLSTPATAPSATSAHGGCEFEALDVNTRRVTGFSAAIPMPAPPRAGLSRSATPMEGLSTPVPMTARLSTPATAPSATFAHCGYEFEALDVNTCPPSYERVMAIAKQPPYNPNVPH